MVDIPQTGIRDNYAWPTAFPYVEDIHDMTVTDNEGNEFSITLQIWIGDQNWIITTRINP